MDSFDSQIYEAFIPVYDVVPEKWEEGREFFVEQLKKISNGVNLRVIGWYLDYETLAGKYFIPGLNNVNDGGTSEQYRTVLRKVIDTGTLPNATTKSVMHGINFDSNFTLIQMYLSATDPKNFKAFTLSNWSNNAGPSIILNMDSTKINITTTTDYSAYTRSYVVLEYCQEL